MAQELKKVGFIGFGDIGLPMAKRLVTHEYELTICGHVRRQPIEEMKKLGAKEVMTPKDVAQASEVTVVMVLTEAQSEDVILGHNGVLEGSARGSGIIMTNTLPPAFCKKVGEAAKPKGVDVLDAPVAGARMGAEAGTLAISVGGEKEVVEKYRPLLETMGRIVYCGKLGMGEVVKLTNNMVALVNSLVAAEALTWGLKNGASEEMLLELMKLGSANSWILQNWGFAKAQLADPPPPTFGIASKDLAMVIKISHDIGQPLPIAALCCELFKTGPRKAFKML